MSNIQYWFLDFDDTLASASATWAIESAFPRLVQRHDLPFDQNRLFEALIVAQERASVNPNAALLLDELLETMGWGKAYSQELMEDMRSYRPVLFADVIPFLERLRQHGKTAYILSNNPHIPKFAASMGIEDYFEQIFTPDDFPDGYRKPDPRVWSEVSSRLPHVTKETSAIVGDDPWSEGLFAEKSGITCWIIDRLSRYTTIRANRPYRWVASFDDIHLC